jgi:gliding motility-associated lipoprotein GldH
MKILQNKISIALAFMLIALSACDKNRVYDEITEIEENIWQIAVEPKFEFEITDVSQAYNLKLSVRNAASYPFYNIYITYFLFDSEGKQLASEMKEFDLMDPKTGEPLGSGMGDIFDHQFMLIPNYKFEKAGKYTMKYKQYMRKDPLPAIMAIGTRVEIATEK